MIGCNGEDDATNAGDASVEEALTVTTYNIGMAVGYVPYATQRIEPAVAAVAALETDIFCGQEYWEWDESTITPLTDSIAAFNSELSNTFYIDPSQDRSCPGGCTATEMGPLSTCMREACAEVDPGELVNCGIANCPDAVSTLGGACVNCVVQQIGSDLDQIEAACGSENFEPIDCYAYGGSFGTLIASKYPFIETSHTVLESHTNRRGVLYAHIDTPMGGIHTFCTHLTAAFTDIPFPEEIGSWQEEQMAQIDALRAFIDEKAKDGQVILLGDFNTGPVVEGRAVAEVPDNYAALIEGFSSAYPTQADADCTFCADNPLIGSGDHEEAVLIDHILVRGFEDHTVEVMRVLNGRLNIDDNGTEKETAYSDHYGLSATIY